MLEITTKPFFALLSLALFMAVVTAEIPNAPSEMEAFHEAFELLPNSTSNEKIVNSSEIIAEVKMGKPVSYDNVVIIGDLNFSNLGMPKSHIERTLPDLASGLSEDGTLINSSIKINNSIIDGHFIVNNIIFNNSFNLENSQINKNLVIQGTEFRDFANFRNSEFDGISQFRHSWFKKDVCFSGVAFDSMTNFSDSRFEGDVGFVNVYFGNITTFSNSRFKGDVHFELSQFDNNAVFTSSNFGYTWFYRYSDFSNVGFNGDALFNKIYFANGADFRDARFNKFLDFESSEFVGDALFQNATFRDGISLKRTKWDKFFVNFDSIKDGLEFDPAAYQLLIKNYNNLGFFDEADSCYFQFMKQQLKHRDPLNNPLLFIFDFGTYIFYGYGVRISYPAVWSVLIVALFGIYWGKEGVKEPFTFSILLFLSGTKIFIGSPERQTKHSGPKLKDLFIIEKTLGAIFSVLLFLTVSRLIIRG